MPTRGLRCTPVTEALPADTLPQHTLSQVASMQPHTAADLSTTPEQPLGIYGRTMVLLPTKMDISSCCEPQHQKQNR